MRTRLPSVPTDAAHLANELRARVFDSLQAANGRKTFAVMAVAVVRFDPGASDELGKRLAHAFARVLDEAGTQLTLRGELPDGVAPSGSRFIKAPKVLTTAARAEVARRLSLAAPGSSTVDFFAKDGEPSTALPERWAVTLKVGDAPGPDCWASDSGGTMSVALPLESLGAPDRLFALVDDVMTALRADVAWAGPGVWEAPRVVGVPQPTHLLHAGNSSRELPLVWARDPQLMIPDLYSFLRIEPSPFEGWTAPAWALWARNGLARRIKRFSGELVRGKSATRFLSSAEAPFEMTTPMYRTWRKRWAELAPLHLVASGGGELPGRSLECFARPEWPFER